MKKLVLLSILLLNLMTIISFSSPSYSNNTKVILNDAEVVFKDVNPYIDKNGRLLIPLRGIFEILNMEIEWIQDRSEVQVHTDKNTTLTLHIGDNSITKSVSIGDNNYHDDIYTIDTTPIIKDGRTMIPLRGIFELANGTVTWDSKNNLVIINCNPQEPKPSVDKSDRIYFKAVSEKGTKPLVWIEPIFYARLNPSQGLYLGAYLENGDAYEKCSFDYKLKTDVSPSELFPHKTIATTLGSRYAFTKDYLLTGVGMMVFNMENIKAYTGFKVGYTFYFSKEEYTKVYNVVVPLKVGE